MNPESAPLTKKQKRLAQLEHESNKVLAFISELKKRLSHLKHEEERIVKISDTLLKKHIGSPFSNKRISPEDIRKIKELRKQVWESEEKPGFVDTNNFQTAMKRFQDLQAGILDPNMNLELFRLRSANVFLKKRMENLKCYIAKLRNSDPNPEDDVCEQLFQASQDVLKKISELDNEINDANTMIASSSKSKAHSRQNSLQFSGKSSNSIDLNKKESLTSVLSLQPNK